MKYAVAASAAVFLNIAAAHALQHPQPAVPLDKGGDPHVQVAIYDPTQPVLLVGAVGRPMSITFSPIESIVRVLLENAANIDGKQIPAPWDGPNPEQAAQTPLGNILPLWAVRAGRSSAQAITQTPDGAQRVYQFQLIALPPQPNTCIHENMDDCDDPRLTTGLSFTYPAEKGKPSPQSQQEALQARVAAQRLAAEERLKTDIFSGERNWRFMVKGQPDAVKVLAPDQISDNSQVTGLLYLGNRQAPALYVVEPDGSERQVTPTPDKDLLLVYETARHWRLRKGTQVADIFNVGYDDIGANPFTGTISPDVMRVTRTVPIQQK